MNGYRLTAYCAPGDAHGMRERVAAITSSWPDRGQPPTFEVVDAAELQGADEAALCDRVVLIGPGAAAGRELLKLADRLRTASATGVVLAEQGDMDSAGSSEGIVVLDRSSPADRVAVALHAVCCCAESTAELRRELRIAQKTSGGVREEMSRISQELSLASKIQQELVPKRLPEIDGIDLGVLYRPAGFVSGDIYNVAVLDERRVAFFIADAVGHGVPAALLTMIISRSLPMRPSTEGDELITPTEALTTLNRELCDVSDGTPRFATAVYGIVDTVSGLVRVANGGHPQPLRIRSDSVAKIEAGGPLLGVFEQAEFEEEIFTLEPGETLLLYSDGFETAFPDADAVLLGGAPSPSQRYLDQLLSIGRRKPAAGDTVGSALRVLESRLDSARGSLHQADDVTALALERRAA